MTAEDVRGEAMRSKEKYDIAMAEITRLNAYIEEKRILNLKIQTTFRKRCENLEMQVQDFEQERLRLENEVEIMEARLEMK
jgi:3-deoxy-D-manno-octulosonate 8-phosphate phosphatase KdsC-like HAD superfamily phosphatase